MADKDNLSDPDAPENPEARFPTRLEAEPHPAADTDQQLNIFEGVRQADGNPVMPVQLKPADMFCFSCHKEVPCWNECCHGADVILTPADILGLTKHLGMQPKDFLLEFTLPDIWEKNGLPICKLRMTGEDAKGPCVFMDDDAGCTVYESRPATCRYYPLGMATVKMKDAETKDDFHFLVKEPHCKGHDEDKLQSVSGFMTEQGVTWYDGVNRGWYDIMMKMASWKVLGGPGGKDIPQQTKRMFYMVSTDIDAFRRFVFESKFLDTYLIDDEAHDILKSDDEALLTLGFDWMKNVMFQEPTISMRENVLQGAIAKARENLGVT